MIYLDIDYATKIMGSLHRSVIKRNGGGFRINARCPVCGDSVRDIYKARFWIYPSKKGDHYNAGCFNCGYNEPFSVFLKEYFPDDYRSYMMEKFKDENKPSKQRQEAIAAKPDVVIPEIPKLSFCERLDTLSTDHPIVKYVQSRCIPKNKYDRLWFTREWRKLVNEINPETYADDSPEPRLVIPIFTKDGKIESFQGRALRKQDEYAKYVTIKSCEEASKVYGQDTIDPLKTVYITEGPIDSLFVENGGAICGGQMALADVPYKNTRVWVLDNEARHPDTTKRLKTLIDQGERVVMWDKSPWKSKDINEMVKSENASLSEIQTYLKENTVSGLATKLRLKAWDKSPRK